MSRFSVEIFLSHGSEKKCCNKSVYRKTSGIEKLFAKVGSRFSVDNFWSHRTEKLRKGTLVFQKFFDIVKIFKDRRGLGYHGFPSKVFVSQCTEKNRCESFVFQKTGSKISHISRFLSTNICLIVPKKICCNTSVCRKTSGIEKTFCRGGSLFSVEIFLSHRTETIRKGTLLCFRKLLV